MNQHVVFLIVCLVCAHAYKTGPPIALKPEVCQNMFPEHGADASSNSNNPFTIKTHSCFAPGQTVKIEIKTSKDSIEGLFIQARTGDFQSANTSYGTFSTNTQNTITYDCFGKTKNSLGHQGEPKVTTLTATWTAPSVGLTQDVKIGGTLLLHKAMFWTNVYNTISYQANCKQPTDSSTHSAAASPIISASLILLLLFIHSFFN